MPPKSSTACGGAPAQQTPSAPTTPERQTAAAKDPAAQPPAPKKRKVRSTSTAATPAGSSSGPAESPEYGPVVTMNTKSARGDPNVKWLIEVWLENGGPIKELLQSDTGLKPCNKGQYLSTLKKWLFKCRTMEQVDFIIEILRAEFARKGKKLKVNRKELRITVEIQNKLEAFQDENGNPFWVLSGTDTYFLADLANYHLGKWNSDEKAWEGIQWSGKADIVERCQKFGIPIDVVDEEAGEEAMGEEN